MSKPIIAIKLSARNYAGLVNLGNRTFASMTGSLDFVTPSPALSVVQTDVTAVVNAIAAWGPKGNRGNHNDLLNLRQQALTLSQTLKALSQYVQTTAQVASGSDYVAMATMITGSGFGLSNIKSPQGILEKVQAFHQFVSRQLNRNEVKLKWKKPLNVVSRSNVKSYRVLRNTSTDLTTAVEVAITQKGTFTDTNTTAAAVVWTYWVVAYNTAGAGIVSDAVTVAVLNA